MSECATTSVRALAWRFPVTTHIRVLGSCFALTIASVLAGCGGSEASFARFPAGHPILLLDGPAHLGDNRAEGQDFPNGDAAAARVCSLVSLQQPAMAYLEVQNVRHTESLGDLVTVNDKPIRLPMTLERDSRGTSSNSTTASPIELISLSAGPSEICLVSGLRPSGDLDDFEIDQIVLFVQGVDADDVQVRRNLSLGRPALVVPPSVPWGRDQQPYVARANGFPAYGLPYGAPAQN
jgi:hypothetical protein